MWKRSVISLVVVLALLLACAPSAKAQILNTNDAKRPVVGSALADASGSDGAEGHYTIGIGRSLVVQTTGPTGNFRITDNSPARL